ncbi:hypothetical protein [Actinomadura monticuli]|uniref:Uncharacterized protein n=1 Tax=Actinomadura monticuli TaxID=3097367 RepID=A0ABV4QGJ7_9ACTN
MSEESRETSDQEPGDNTGDAPSSTELPAQDIAFAEPPTDDPARTASTDSFRARFLAEVAEERTSSVHEYLRYTLIGELFRAGRTPQVDSPLIDTACDDSSGWMLFEVLGEDGNTYPRMREGAIRLTDIEFAEGRTAEHRFLVLPEQPERGAIDAIAERHGTHIIWPEGQGWGGTGFDRAFGGNHR